MDIDCVAILGKKKKQSHNPNVLSWSQIYTSFNSSL